MRSSVRGLVFVGVASLLSLTGCEVPGERSAGPAVTPASTPVEAKSSPAAVEPVDPAEDYPLGPEMAQLERDIASEGYRAMVLGWTNYNDLEGELNRADLPGNAERFAHAHGGVEEVERRPALRAGYERRLAIERGFLDLMEDAYRGLGKEAMFVESLDRIRSEAARSLNESEHARASDLAAELPDAPSIIAPILPAPGAENEWPRWRGPSGQGLSSETDLPVEWGPETNVAWKTPIPGRGNSSPVIWGEKIWLTTAFEDGGRRALVCIAREDGELLWVRDAPAASFETKHIAKNSWASPTPIVDGERVIAYFGNGGLVAFDLEGETLWHYPMPWFDGTHGTGASPAISGEVVVLVQEHNRGSSIAVGVDRQRGDEVWKRELEPALGWSSVLPLRVGERDEVVVGVHHRVIALDPGTGEELWSATGPTREVVPTIVYGDGLVYSCSGRNGPTIAVRPGGDGDVTETHVVWSVVRGAPHVPSPILVGGLIYFTNDTGILTCLDAKDGETVYQKRLSGKFTASPIAADGKVYFTNESGETFVVRQGPEHELLAVNALEETTLASMAVLDGRLYIRSEQHLWAIE